MVLELRVNLVLFLISKAKGFYFVLLAAIFVIHTIYTRTCSDVYVRKDTHFCVYRK